MQEASEIEHAAAISGELRLAMLAAQVAGDIIQRGMGQELPIEQKDVGDLVSAIDLEAEQAVLDLLQQESCLPVLSEELHPEIGDVDEFWIVDPLDGSTAYLMGADPGLATVLIALRQGGETTLGVCYFPLTGEWFYAQRGRGAWRDGRRLVCDLEESLQDVWVDMNQYGNAQWETDYFARMRHRLRSPLGARLVTNSPAHSGVAMRIAAGSNQLAVAIHDNNPLQLKQAAWDIAAPQVILEEAGGVFVNAEGCRIDPFCPEPMIVARSEKLARQVVGVGMPCPVPE